MATYSLLLTRKGSTSKALHLNQDLGFWGNKGWKRWGSTFSRTSLKTIWIILFTKAQECFIWKRSEAFCSLRLCSLIEMRGIVSHSIQRLIGLCRDRTKIAVSPFVLRRNKSVMKNRIVWSLLMMKWIKSAEVGIEKHRYCLWLSHTSMNPKMREYIAIGILVLL